MAKTPAARSAERSTRDALIDAAMTIVAREGLEAASVKRIAAEAGITPGLLHYHFAGKDALLEAALRRSLEAYQALSQARRATLPPDQQLPALFADALEAVTRDADFFRLRLAFAARALTDPPFAAALRELSAEAAEQAALTLAAAAGRSEPTADERRMALVMKAAFDGIMLARLIDPDFPMEEASRRLKVAFTA